VNKIRARAVTARASNAVVAQLVEQLIRNQQVSGSNPLNGSSLFSDLAPAARPALCVIMPAGRETRRSLQILPGPAHSSFRDSIKTVRKKAKDS
jgi:hypothetical protein